MIATGGGGASQDVTIRLRLVPDDSNKNAVDRFKADADKIRKEFEKGFSMGAGKDGGAGKGFDDYSKKMVAGMSGASDKMVAINQKANDRIKAGFASVAAEAKRQADKEASIAKKAADDKIAQDNRVMRNRIKMLADVAANEKRQARQSEANERKLLGAQIRQDRAVHRGFSGAGNIAGGIGSMARGGLLLGADNENVEKLAQNYIKIEAAFSIFHGGLQTMLAINREMTVYRQATAAAALETQLLARSTAGAGAGAGASSVGGTGATAGIGAASAGGGAALGSLATTAAFAATAVTVASAGVVLHDAFVTAVNKTGLFSSKLDTLTGTISSWNDAVEANTRLEERYKIVSEAAVARNQEREQMRGQLKTYFEGRERIESSREGTQSADRLASQAKFGVAHIASAMVAPTTHGGLTLAHRRTTEINQMASADDYQSRKDALATKYFKWKAALAPVKRRNDRDQARGGIDVVQMPGKTQEDIDKLQAAHPIEKGTWDWHRLFMGRTTGDLKLMPDASVANGGRDRIALGDPSSPLQPQFTKESPDLQGQLSMQEKALDVAKQRSEIAKQETTELQNQLGVMAQQMLAAKEQVVAAKERVKSEKASVDARNAHFATLTHGEQSALAESLGRIKGGKAKRDDYLIAQHFGANSGALGRTVNAGIAKDIDPKLSGLIQSMGGNEDLDKAQSDLADTTKSLTDAQHDAADGIDDFLDSLQDFDDWANSVTSGTKAVEKTKADMGQSADPNQQNPTQNANIGQNVQVAAVKQVGANGVAATKEVGDAFEAAMKAMAAAQRQLAQRIKGMHG